MRPDLKEEQQGIPIGTVEFWFGEGKLEYRWRDNDKIFEVFYLEKWQEAQSIDFNFIN